MILAFQGEGWGGEKKYEMKEASHWCKVRAVADVRDTSIQISETRLQCVRLCGVLPSNDFIFLAL